MGTTEHQQEITFEKKHQNLDRKKDNKKAGYNLHLVMNYG